MPFSHAQGLSGAHGTGFYPENLGFGPDWPHLFLPISGMRGESENHGVNSEYVLCVFLCSCPLRVCVWCS